MCVHVVVSVDSEEFHTLLVFRTKYLGFSVFDEFLESLQQDGLVDAVEL